MICQLLGWFLPIPTTLTLCGIAVQGLKNKFYSGDSVISSSLILLHGAQDLSLIPSLPYLSTLYYLYTVVSIAQLFLVNRDEMIDFNANALFVVALANSEFVSLGFDSLSWFCS